MKDPESVARLYHLAAPSKALAALADFRAYVLGAAYLPLVAEATPTQVISELRRLIVDLVEAMRGKEPRTIPTRWAELAQREMAERMARMRAGGGGNG